jgi:hypothetical protein
MGAVADDDENKGRRQSSARTLAAGCPSAFVEPARDANEPRRREQDDRDAAKSELEAGITPKWPRQFLNLQLPCLVAEDRSRDRRHEDVELLDDEPESDDRDSRAAPRLGTCARWRRGRCSLACKVEGHYVCSAQTAVVRGGVSVSPLVDEGSERRRRARSDVELRSPGATEEEKSKKM